MGELKSEVNGDGNRVFQKVIQGLIEKDPMDLHFKNLIQSTRRFAAIFLTSVALLPINQFCRSHFQIEKLVQHREILFIWFLSFCIYAFYCFALWVADIIFAVMTAREEFKKKQKAKELPKAS